MPEWFRQYLKFLTPEQKDELWNWLDGEPGAVEYMIENIGRADGKPNVNNKSTKEASPKLKFYLSQELPLDHTM